MLTSEQERGLHELQSKFAGLTYKVEGADVVAYLRGGMFPDSTLRTSSPTARTGRWRSLMSTTNTALCILILEDDVLLQRSFARIFRRRGYEVSVAGTVEEFREKLSAPFSPTRQLPDVIMLDREVAGSNGWAMKDLVPETARVLLMTGNPPADAPPHLLKPINVTELLAAVEGMQSTGE